MEYRNEYALDKIVHGNYSYRDDIFCRYTEIIVHFECSYLNIIYK